MVVAGCPGAAARGTCNVKTKVVFVIYTALTFTKLTSALPWSLILAPSSVGFLQYSSSFWLDYFSPSIGGSISP